MRPNDKSPPKLRAEGVRFCERMGHGNADPLTILRHSKQTSKKIKRDAHHYGLSARAHTSSCNATMAAQHMTGIGMHWPPNIYIDRIP